MYAVLNKKILWAIVIWFAILQMLSPLIHAHVEADTPEQGHGLHMHAEDLFQAQDKIHHIYSIVNSMHTVGIEKALVKTLDLLPLPLFTLLFIICSLAVISRLPRCQFSASPPHPFYLRPQLSPRAPPLF
jgi:energy-converting hydrogenase Eha subunit H